MKKLLLLFCLILQIFTLGGCKGEPFIVFSAQDPKNGLNKNQIEYNFKKNSPYITQLSLQKALRMIC